MFTNLVNGSAGTERSNRNKYGKKVFFPHKIQIKKSLNRREKIDL